MEYHMESTARCPVLIINTKRPRSANTKAGTVSKSKRWWILWARWWCWTVPSYPIRAGTMIALSGTAALTTRAMHCVGYTIRSSIHLLWTEDTSAVGKVLGGSGCYGPPNGKRKRNNSLQPNTPTTAGTLP